MARVETGHIHLRSSILHHTESWGNKELGKEKKNRENTQKHRTAMGTPARMQTQRTYEEEEAALI